MYTGGKARPNQVVVGTAPSSSRDIITNKGRGGRDRQCGRESAGGDSPWQRCGEKDHWFSMTSGVTSGVQHFTPKTLINGLQHTFRLCNVYKIRFLKRGSDTPSALQTRDAMYIFRVYCENLTPETPPPPRAHRLKTLHYIGKTINSWFIWGWSF